MYPWPPTEPHELWNISVTSAIKGGLPKPYLIGWAAKVTAECAVDRYSLLGQMIEGDSERAAIDWLKQARFRDMAEKADRGTIVHAAIESYLAGNPIDKEAVKEQLREARVPVKLHRSAFNMIEGVRAFLDDFEPEVLLSEATVYSRTHQYAGTLDILGRVTVGKSRVPAVIDIKTSKRIYDEVALQLVGYARADFVGLLDGTEQPFPLRKGEKVEYGIVVRPKPSGGYEHAVFGLSDELFERYLAILAVARTEGLEGKARRKS
jgi:hypothetical protein